MERLNYHHLLYFWAVVREGSIALRGSNGLLLAAARDNDLARARVAEVGSAQSGRFGV